MRKLIPLAFMLVFLTFTREAKADLIEIFPTSNNPQSFGNSQVFFDSAIHGTLSDVHGQNPRFYNEWISLYGAVDGGTYFFTDLFDYLNGTNTVSVWWDFRNYPSSPNSPAYWLSYITVWGYDADQVFQQKIFWVPLPEGPYSPPQTITMNQGVVIEGLAFYGTNKIPEPASVMLLSVALMGLAMMRRRRRSGVL